jgi:hypothetical protein
VGRCIFLWGERRWRRRRKYSYCYVLLPTSYY